MSFAFDVCQWQLSTFFLWSGRGTWQFSQLPSIIFFMFTDEDDWLYKIKISYFYLADLNSRWLLYKTTIYICFIVIFDKIIHLKVLLNCQWSDCPFVMKPPLMTQGASRIWPMTPAISFYHLSFYCLLRSLHSFILELLILLVKRSMGILSDKVLVSNEKVMVSRFWVSTDLNCFLVEFSL